MEQSVRSDLIVFDWFSFTTTEFNDIIKYNKNDMDKRDMWFFDFCLRMGLDPFGWQLIRGAHGYKQRFWRDNISVHFDGSEQQGVWVEFSGQGCRVFETESLLSWEQLFEYVRSINGHVTRLDVAFDDHTGVLPMDRILLDAMQGHYVSKLSRVDIFHQFKNRIDAGSSVEVGKGGKVVLRVYDKARERGITDGSHWIRVEFQLRDDRATLFLAQLGTRPIGDLFAGLVFNYFRFLTPDPNDSNMARWEMTEYWADLLEGAKRVSVYSRVEREYNVDHFEEVTFHQFGNMIDCAMQGYGYDRFMQLLNSRRSKPNPKYAGLLPQIWETEAARAEEKYHRQELYREFNETLREKG